MSVRELREWNSSDLQFGSLVLNNTDDSTSSSTGVLIINGGAYVGKNLGMGGSMSMVSTRDATGLSTGALVVNGGASIAKSLYVGGNESVIGTIDTSGTSTGSLTVAGGVGIGKYLNVGSGASIFGNLNVNGTFSRGPNFGASNMNVATSMTIWDDTTHGNDSYIQFALASVGADSRKLQISGGGWSPYYTEFLMDASILTTTQATDTQTGSLIVSGGASVGKNVFIGGQLNAVSTVDSTNTTTGALLVSGGAGIGKALRVGGATSVLSTVVSTSTSTGALLVSGGVGITGDVYCNNLIRVGGFTSTLTSVAVGGGAVGNVSYIKFANVLANVIMMSVSAFTATGAVYASIYTAAGTVPTAFRPSRNQKFTSLLISNSADVTGSITIQTDGTILWNYSFGGGANVNGWYDITCVYMINS